MASSWDASILPDFTVTESEVGIKTLISKGEAGRERRRSKVATPRNVLKLKFGVLTTTQIDWVYNHYVERKAALLVWTFTRPPRGPGDSSKQYTVRFRQDGLDRDWFNANLHKLGIEVIEAT